MAFRIVCLSDTHSHHDQLSVPNGDLLVHAGDFTNRGAHEEIEAFAAFLDRLPHRQKVVVAGNHDFLFQDEPEEARGLLGDVIYLQDSATQVQGLRIWGSPWQPWFWDWAFNLPRGDAIAEKWALVPASTDLLVTHGPPMGILDTSSSGRHLGCEELERARERIRPRLHVFGHIHEGYGTHRGDGVLSVNASNCDSRYRPVQPPIVVEWDGAEMNLVEP